MALWPAAWRANLPWAGAADAFANIADVQGSQMPNVFTRLTELQQGGWKLTRGVYDFAVHTGAQGTVDIFDVEGDVMVQVLGVVETACTGATATVELGVAGTVNLLLAQTTAADLTVGDLWHDATPTTDAEIVDVYGDHTALISQGKDIILTIATADLTAGKINFYAFWKPLSNDGDIVAA